MSTSKANHKRHAWLRRMSDAEDAVCAPSVGGLAARLGVLTDDTSSRASMTARRVALARLIELSRRRLGLTIGDVAARTGLTPMTIASVERGDELTVAPAAMRKLADTLALPRQGLASIVHPTKRTDSRIDDAVMRFAVHVGPVRALSPSERAALKQFVATLTKPTKRKAKKSAA